MTLQQTSVDGLSLCSTPRNALFYSLKTPSLMKTLNAIKNSTNTIKNSPEWALWTGFGAVIVGAITALYTCGAITE